MKLELTKEQVTYFKSLEVEQEKVKFIMNCIIENLEADLNLEKSWFDATKEEVLSEQSGSGDFLDEFTGVLGKRRKSVTDNEFMASFKNPFKWMNESVGTIELKPMPLFTSEDFGSKKKTHKEIIMELLEPLNKFNEEAKKYPNAISIIDNKELGFGLAVDISLLDNAKSENMPLFTAEDGVDIFKDEKFYPVELKSMRCVGTASFPDFGRLSEKHKYFSSIEVANEWVLMNKPLLSLEDLLSVWALGPKKPYLESPLFLSFKKLAKSKL